MHVSQEMLDTLGLEVVRTFEAAARTGSFTAAARATHRTQSAVSMQIKRLEQAAGTPLFFRSGRGEGRGRGVSLTPAGEALLPYARRLLCLHGEAAQLLASLSADPLAGTLRLGCPEDYATVRLPDVLARFAAVHPGVRVDVWCDTSDRLLAMLERGALDVTLATHAHAPPPSATCEVLTFEPLVWVGPAEDAILQADPLPLAVFHEGCGYRERAMRALEATGRAYRLALVSPSVAGLGAAVRAGLAVAPVAASVAAGFAGQGCRVLDASSGLPALPAAPIALHYTTRTTPNTGQHHNHPPKSSALAHLVDSLRLHFAHLQF